MAEPLEVVLVCCGEPKKSMGWFHLTQLIGRPDVRVSTVVEPWFLGQGANAAGAARFSEFKDAHPSINFCSSMDELKAREASGPSAPPRLVLIAGRTCDAPALFSAAVEKGATHIYVEKPGAVEAASLMEMQEKATAQGVAVVIGYNKNVSKYVRDAVEELRSRGDPSDPRTLPPVTLEHCNAFSPGPALLEFLRGPGAEGMLHNMSCHELALAATRFGVRRDRVRSVTLFKKKSELLGLGDGRYDWSRIAFKLELTPNAPGHVAPPGCVALDEITLSADRCGGNFSRIVLGAVEGSDSHEMAFRLPDAELEERITKAQKQDPEIRPYFLQQADDYEELKGEFIKHILAGKAGIPDGVVGLDGAIEALRLADFLSQILQKCWVGDECWRGDECSPAEGAQGA